MFDEVGAIRKPDLQALRDMGAAGLIIELAALDAGELSGLKSALLAMPRPRRRRARMRATVPGAGFSSPTAPSREDDDDAGGGDDDDYDYE